MTTDQWLIVGILAVTVGMFLWGRLRYDFVALGALLACVIVGIVPADDAFAGFGNSAVMTVFAVLILSKSLEDSGAIDILGKKVLPEDGGLAKTTLALLLLGAVLSSFVNNVGAMALLMPLAIRIANDHDLPPGKLLMPLAFATILGGMTTLIGTPPNLIVSGYRSDALDGGFGMFAFTPVGATVAVFGIGFLLIGARRLVPNRKPSAADDFHVGRYRADFVVQEGSDVVGTSIGELQGRLADASFNVSGILRDGQTRTTATSDDIIEAGDRLEAQATTKLIGEKVDQLGLVVVHEHTGDHTHSNNPLSALNAKPEGLREVVVLPSSRLERKRVREVGFNDRFNIDLLALKSKNETTTAALDDTRLRAGDLLLVRGTADQVAQFASTNQCAPLADRNLQIANYRAPVLATVIMVASVGLAAFGVLPTAVSFMLGAFAVAVTNLVPVRRIYDAVDWSIIVLLAAMLPVAGAMESTGAAEVIAKFMLDNLAGGSAIIALILVLVLTMFMSDAMNNAATAAVMCPIGIQSAQTLDVNPDTFLMAVAVGASCAFLTPIGHQNNTLILGPGGFKFGDYWKFGLPLEVIIVVVGIPALLLFWPL